MPSALWKIAALASVMGIAGFVLFEIHGKLPQTAQQQTDPNSFPPVNGEDGTDSQQLLANSSIDDASKTDAVGLPPEGQGEPTGQASPLLATRSAFVEQGNRAGQATVDVEPATAFDQLPEAAASDTGDYNPFADSSSSAQPIESSDSSLLTANAQLPAPPGGNVEQVGATRPDSTRFNPFASTDDGTATISIEHETDVPLGFNPFETQFEPVSDSETPADTTLALETDEPAALAGPESAGEAPLELNLAVSPEDSAAETFDPTQTYDPTLELQSEPTSDAALAESTTAELPPDSDASATDAGQFDLRLDFGPQDNASLANDPSLSDQQSEPSPTFGPAATEAPPSDPSTVEPSRFPAGVIDDDGPPQRTALRSRNLAPLQPAQNTQEPPQNEPPFQIIPNPLPASEPAAPSRSDFVGDATIDDGTAPGPQQPELTIQKVAPTDATVGDPLVYAIKVKNVGNSAARDVIVEDRIPRGTTLEGSIPQAELTDRKLIWQLGDMEPGDEKTIRIKVVPTEAGEIGSVATVRFVAEVAATTRITTPNLTMDLAGPPEVTVGEQAVFKFRIANVGEGEARNVYVRNLLPTGFEHPGGRDIEYDVGTLRPGESRNIDLAVQAAAEGVQTLTAQLNTGTTTRTERQAPVKVIQSRLFIQRKGPRQRFVGRPADYTTVVTNRSSSALQQVTVVEQLDPGMELAAVPEGGHFDAQKRTITWRIPELAAGAEKTFQTKIIASEKGTLRGVVKATDAKGNEAQLASVLEVAGFASLTVDLEHERHPVGVGDPVAMQLTVKNRGTGTAENVEAQFAIPDHLTFVNAEGPVQFELDQTGRMVKFAAIDELAANEEQTFKIMLTAAAPGNTPVTAELSTADLAGPLKHAEAVLVEADGQ